MEQFAAKAGVVTGIPGSSKACQVLKKAIKLTYKWHVGIRTTLNALLVVQTSMLLFIGWNTAPGWDEWGHLPSGLCHLQFGRFEPYRVNPPLIRMIAALPVWLVGGGITNVSFVNSPGERQEWELATTYMYQHGESCFTYFAIARMGVLGFPILGTVLIWKLGRRWYGISYGWIPAALWVFSPTVLAFGASITPDVPMAVLGLWAIDRFWDWLQSPSWKNAVIFAIATAFAMLCKMSWIIFPPILLGLWFFWKLRQRQLPSTSDVSQWLVISMVVWFVIGANYEFQGIGKPIGEMDFVSSALRKSNHSESNIDEVVGNRFRNSWIGRVRFPLPENYLLGVDIQKRDFEAAMSSYFLGVWRHHGWYQYYAVGILLKEPIAICGLILISLASMLKKRSHHFTSEHAVYFVPGIAIFLFVSSQTGFNHHIRYVLPFFPVLYLACGSCVFYPRSHVRIVAPILVSIYALSSVSALPRSYAFFSEAVGGSNQGWRYLSDSNLDWGQDLLTLKKWLAQNDTNQNKYLLYSIPLVDPKILGLGVERGDDRLIVNDSGIVVPAAVGMWIVFSRRLTNPEGAWFRVNTPVIQLSPTIRIYNIREISTDVDLGQDLVTLNGFRN